MIRNVSMDEISDGKLYDLNDMVKADSRDCSGCHACCCNMGDSIILDPYDAYNLCRGLEISFSELINGPVRLTLADGIILPALAMTGTENACSFLNGNGRCSIHSFRPGLCRLFPLGRKYEDNSFSYFLQSGQCQKEHLSKVKIKNWIGVPNEKQYELFILRWHFFLKKASAGTAELDETLVKVLHSYILKNFYLMSYSTEQDFYEQFFKRLNTAEAALDLH